MEVKAAEILWKRYIKNCGMRYVSILSDGDAKTYQHLSSLNLYGNCIKIAKEECINHVAKRLGTGLHNKILEWRNKDKTPKHSKCPTGSTSCCFYQRALAKNENPMSHSLMNTKLSEQVLEKYFQYIKGL
ncbi:uncharacterized protein TNCV_945651 [Trichonephila clavipes]|nr:uncharacterized protein TNCV_945651 [Trichonephila clavipes]